MNERIALRSATVADAEAIAPLLAELGHPLSAEVVRTSLRRIESAGEAFFTFCAVDGERVVGLVSGFATPVLHREEPDGRVSVLVVAQSHAGHGVGAALLEAAHDRLAALGCGRVEVSSAVHRTDAHEFYRRKGYREQGLRFVRALRGTEEIP